jgi:prevent-host-death family protein
MQKIGAFEAKTHFSALLARVEKGEGVIITKRGNPIAQLIGFNNKVTSQQTKKNAILKLLEFNSDNFLNGLDWKSLRDTGRR